MLKSRGTAHSNQVREFVLTSQGVQLKDVYVGPEGVLTGSMRLAQEIRERNAQEERKREVETKMRAFERRRAAMEAQLASLRAELEEEEAAIRRLTSEEAERERRMLEERTQMGNSRKEDATNQERHEDEESGARN